MKRKKENDTRHWHHRFRIHAHHRHMKAKWIGNDMSRKPTPAVRSGVVNACAAVKLKGQLSGEETPTGARRAAER
eukprot:2384108-Rhodomonas_salina.2